MQKSQELRSMDGVMARLARCMFGRRLCRTSAMGLFVACAALWVCFCVAGVALASVPSTAIRYDYDADGQLKAVVNPASETALYSWDPAGNLLSIGLKSATKLALIELAPVQGAVGETVTISGTGFSKTKSEDTVKFNGTAATVSVATEWSLTVKVPSGATSGTVTVQTKSEGPVTSAQSFTVAGASAPKISSLSPKVASTGTEVTVAGSNFESNAYNNVVTFSSTRPELLSESSTAIKLKVPGSTGTGPVVVGTPQGVVTGPDLFIPPNGIPTSDIGATGELALGSSDTVKVAKAAEDVALVAFSGTAGQRVSLVTSEASYRGWVSVWTPGGSRVSESEMGFSSGEGPQLDGPVTLPVTGTYTILVEPSGGATGSVKLSAYSVTDVKGSITPTAEGAATGVSITTPGQRAIYTIAGTAGESVSLKTSSAAFSPDGGWIEWENPEAATIETYNFSNTGSQFIKQVKFATTGTYTLIVHPAYTSTGSMTLTAYNASDVKGTITPSSGGETKTVTIGVPGQFARYTFTGTKGERVSLVLSEASYHGWVSVWTPEGARVPESEEGFSSGEGPELNGPLTLPVTGTYTILVEPSEGATGSVKLSAYSVTDVKGSITPTAEGAATGVSITTPGQRAIYTIAGTAGESVSLKTSSTSFSPQGGSIEWENPEGNRIESYYFTNTGSQFMKQVRFATTGTYTVIVHPSGTSTGSMTLMAYNASDVKGTITPSSGGETKMVTIGVPGQFARYTFAGTEGETVTLKAQESTISNGWMSVWSPSGFRVSESEANFSGSGASVEIVLLSTGTYTILLEPAEGDTGSVKLTAYTGSHPAIVRRLAESTSAAALTRPTPTPSANARSAGSPLAHASSKVARRASADGISPEMRRFHPRDGASWRPRESRLHQAWESDDQPTPWTSAPRLQGGYGVTAMSGQVLAEDGLPLVGVNVAIQGTYLSTKTDEAGRFLLSRGVPAGRVVLVVEDESGGQRYGSYEIGIDIPKGKTTALPYTIWLTPLDREGDLHISSPAKHEVRLTTPEIPGLEVRIPAGSVITNRAGQIVHSLNVTAIPIDRTPFPLPPFSEPILYFTAQPGGASLSKGAQVVYPNVDHRPPGQRVDFWNYSPERGWYIYGKGTVTPDGKQVVPDPGTRLWEFSGSMGETLPEPPAAAPTAGAAPVGADPIDFRTGLFVYHARDLVLPDVIPIVIERTYRQSDSNSYGFGVGTNSTYGMRLWSKNQYKEFSLILPDGGRVRYVRTSPGEGYPESEFEATETPSVYYGSTVKWNGHGWNLTLTNGITYVFGVYAPLQAIRDRFGNQLTITHAEGEKGNITQITSPHGSWVKFTYNSTDDITEIKDNAGRTLKYAYNKAGLLESATDAAGRTTSYEYNGAGEMTSAKDGRGRIYVETEYEAHERVAKQTVADGGIYSFGYVENPETKVVEATTMSDPRKTQRKVTFNREGFPTSEIYGVGSGLEETTTYERQATTGFPLAVTDPLGRKTTYKYDSSGNITQATLLSGTSSARTLEYAYEPGTNELTAFTNALKQKTTYHYGANGELLSETDPLAHKTSYEYNAEGQPIAATNPLGKTTKYGYEFGALASITDPLGRTTTQFVNAFGEVGSVTSPEGQRTLHEYNPDDQVTKITDPLGAVTSYEYDGDGDLVAVTDPNKHRATYAYEAMDRLESSTDALEHTEKVVHDQDGNVIEVVDRDGKVSKFTYDALNRLTEARYGVSGESAESTIKYEYDAGNRLKKIVDSATGTYTPEYDELNRLKSLATPNGTISYEYNEANERTAMTVPGQEPVKYTYDEAGRLTEIKRGSEAVTLTYNEANLPTKTTLPDGIEENYSHDEANELTAITYTKGKTKLGELDYAYDLDGLREATWGSYARSALPEAVSAATYNADDEQTERNGAKVSYDADGNLTSAGGSEYKWNARGQLAEITGAIKAAFSYDPSGRRVSKTISGATTKLLNDEANVVQEVQGSTTTNMFSGLAPHEVFARSTSTTTESLLTDVLGSTIAIGNASGKAETSYTYDPFGATSKEGAASENPVQYAGLESDSDGIYYDRARYYNPMMASFISQDPVGEEANGPNLYRYVGNSPINGTDPSGTMSVGTIKSGGRIEEERLHKHEEEQGEGGAIPICVHHKDNQPLSGPTGTKDGKPGVGGPAGDGSSDGPGGPPETVEVPGGHNPQCP